MKIEIIKTRNLSAKKWDYVKIAWILENFGELTANQINYYFNCLFSNQWSNSQRISQVVRSRSHIFTINENGHRTKTYEFSGSIELHPTTKFNWKNKTAQFIQFNQNK
jgi:hypothetical protein